MTEIVSLVQIESKILNIRDQNVILDSETKEVNQAVKNNPDKFPDGDIVGLQSAENGNWSKSLTDSSDKNIPMSVNDTPTDVSDVITNKHAIY